MPKIPNRRHCHLLSLEDQRNAFVEAVGEAFFNLLLLYPSLHKLTTQHAHRFFHLGVQVPFYLPFWGCKTLNSSFGGTKKMNCIFSTQGRAFCILRVIDIGLSLLYRVGKNFFFLSDRNWCSVCLCVCPTIFL